MDNLLNNIALNQIILKKSLVGGEGFVGGNMQFPVESINGWNVFIDGITVIPTYGKFEETYSIGSMHYSSLLPGMHTYGGDIQYALGVTEEIFVLMIAVMVDEAVADNNEAAEQAVALVYRYDVPEHDAAGNEITMDGLLYELLMNHFLRFLGTTNPQKIIDDLTISSESDILRDALDQYIQLFESGAFADIDIDEEDDGFILSGRIFEED